MNLKSRVDNIKNYIKQIKNGKYRFELCMLF